jgi:glycosyltransferase involved in cell wall biosynthesis
VSVNCAVYDALFTGTGRGLSRYATQLRRHLAAYGLAPVAPAPRLRSVWGRLFISEVYEPFVRLLCNPDISIFPFNATPYLCGRSKGPRVLVVHDVLFLQRRNRNWGNLYRAVKFARSIDHAEFIITVSRASASELRRVIGESREVHILPNVLPDAFLSRFDRRAGWHGRYKVLHFGGTSAHKQTALVIQAVALLRRRGLPVMLLLAGMSRKRQKAESWLRDAGLSAEDALILDYLSDDDLREIYRFADLHCMLSTGEGFGIPLIEAASQHLPNLLSPLPVFHELMGQNAHYVPDWSVSEVSESIEECMETKMNEKADAARERALDFAFDRVHTQNAIPFLDTLVKCLRQ